MEATIHTVYHSNIHCGGLAGSVVSEKGCDLSLVEIETEVTHGLHLLPSARQP